MNAESLSVKRIKTCKQKCCGTALLLSVFMLIQPAYAGNKNVHAPARLDFDGDGKSDIGCYDPNTGDWFIFRSTEGFTSMNWGSARTLPVAEDFDGDGICDYGTYYAPNGEWRIMKSTQGGMTNHFGYAGTVPLTGDFDGDGICDFGCYYAASGAWYIYKSRDGFWANNFGYEGTVPVTGDFDGDGTCDFGCYYAPGGLWYLYKSREGFSVLAFGFETAVAVTGDYDGDGICDIGCYEAYVGGWYLFKSQEKLSISYFGYEGTEPIGCIPAVQRVTLSLSAMPSEGGTVSGAGTYFMGEQVQISAVPASGWHFVGWNNNNRSSSHNETIITNTDMTAYFGLNGAHHTLELHDAIDAAFVEGGTAAAVQYINDNVHVGDTTVTTTGYILTITDIDAYDRTTSTWVIGDGEGGDSYTTMRFFDSSDNLSLMLFISY